MWRATRCRRPNLACSRKSREEAPLSAVSRCCKVSRSIIPAVPHVDNFARIQTVRHEDNPLFHEIISSFYDLTCGPMVVNTSFNVRDEPIVCTPEDAYRCFLKTEMDVLVLESHVVMKVAGVRTVGENAAAALSHS